MVDQVCCECGARKPVIAFRLRTDTGKRRPFCLECEKARKHARYLAKKADHRAAGKRWMAENRERHLTYRRAYQRSEKVRAWKKAYKERQRDAAIVQRQNEKRGLMARGLKRCSKCGQVKRLDQFGRRGRPKQHLYRSACRLCLQAAYRVAHNEMTVRRRQRLAAAHVEPIDRQEVFHRAGGFCGICGESVDSDWFHVDHIIPVSRGGEHSYANVQLAHPVCNQRKNARLDYAAA